ncbi:hypothetical protein NQ317_004366, partial [Molorchus minor]
VLGYTDDVRHVVSNSAMGDPAIKPFLCENLDKALIRGEWEKWLRSLELYLAAEEIDDGVKKRNKLLHLGGTQLQEVAYNIPGAIETYNPEEKNDIFKVLNSTFERHVFRNLKPEDGETINRFLLKVRQQAAKCSFGNTAKEATEISMKDKIIDSWAPIELKKKLLEKEHTLDEIVEICQIHEQIGNQSRVMDNATPGSSTSFSSVNKIAVQNNKYQNKCIRCGKTGHPSFSQSCPARGSKCNKCQLKGHFAFCCKTPAYKYSPKPSYQNKRRRVNFVNAEQDTNHQNTEDNIQNFECFRIKEYNREYNLEQEQKLPEDLVKCIVGRVMLTFLIDSGSKANIICGADWTLLTANRAVIWNIDDQVGDVLKPYATGSSIVVKNKFQSTINLPGETETIDSFYVVEKGEVSLLGNSTAKRLGVLKLGLSIRQVNTPSAFPKVKNVIVKLTIDPSVKPVQQPLRRTMDDNLNYRKVPSELLFNRNIRDKIPSITDLMAEAGDEEARDNDIMNKQKGKEKEDSAKKSENQ